MSPLTTAAASTVTVARPGPPPDPIPPPPAKKPRGNPTLHLAHRCGARTRAGCPCQAPAIRGKLRCRLHGGRSTGPRTPQGRENIRKARTKHGRYSANERAERRYLITLLRRNRIKVAAKRYLDFLHPAFVARLFADYAPELTAPPHPTGGITAAMDRMRRRAVAAGLAPWRRAIADAREAARAAWKQAAAAREAARAADPNARVRPPRPRRQRPGASRPTPQAVLAALLAELQATERAAAAREAGVAEPCVPDGAAAVRDAGMAEPYVPIPSAGRVALAPMAVPDLRNSAAAVPARCAHETSPPEPYVPDRASAAHNVCAAEPCEPFPPADAAAPATAPARAPRLTTHAGLARCVHANAQPEPLVPVGAPGPRQTSAPEPYVPVSAAGPVLPPDLPNRAARRRWMRQQRHRQRASPAGTRP